ncbi:MAG: hypothetical protein ACFFCM_18070, partial [Promethearchaeota archaeon]
GAIFVWQDFRDDPDGDIYAQKIFKNGSVAWTPGGVAIDIRSETENLPEICGDGNGGAIITYQHWHAVSGADIYAQYINSTGDFPWGAAKPICTQNFAQYYPEICTDGDGGGIITWQDYRSGVDFHIYTQCINNSGGIEWNIDGIGIQTTFDNGHPQIISDGNGGALITYEYIDSEYVDVIKINSNGGYEWAKLTDSTVEDSQAPQLCSDCNGGAIITWQDERNGNNDVYAQRVDKNGTVWWDYNGVPICEYISTQERPKICADGFGGAIITWEDLRSFASYDIYAQRISSDGSIQWTANGLHGIPICYATGDQQYPEICSDGSGGAIIAWEDKRGSDWNIYIQIVNSTGDIQGTYNGIPICIKGGDQSFPQICGDDNGSAIITWIDYRGGGTSDVYAQGIFYIQEQIPEQVPQPKETQDILIIPQGGQDISDLLLSPLGLGIIGGIAAYAVIATVLLARKVSETKKEISLIKKEISKKPTSKDISKTIKK